MLRDTGFKPPQEAVNFILMDGGVGDHIASLTALAYISKTYPHVRMLVWIPDFLLEFARHLLPKLLVRQFSSMKVYYDHKLPTKTTKWDQIVSPMKSSLLEYAFLKLCDEKPSIEHMNYLQINPKKIDIGQFNLPKDYIVITTGYTAKVREFPSTEVNKIVDWCKASNLEAVFLGATNTVTGTKHTIKGTFDDSIDYSKGHNLIDKTTLLQAAKIMHESKAVLGVDNGLLHIAACTDAHIIGGFTTVNPRSRIPIRNNEICYKYKIVVPDETLKCRFCQERTNFIFKHDYKECFYKDYECTKHMKAEKFIAHLKTILSL